MSLQRNKQNITKNTKNTWQPPLLKSKGVFRNDCGDIEDTSSSNAHNKKETRTPNVSEISNKVSTTSMLSEAVSEMSNGVSSKSMLSGSSVLPLFERFWNSSDDYENISRTLPSFERSQNFLDDDEDINRCYDYGEPTRFQHLRIDFTPIQGVDDDEELFQKCVGFWDFVNSRPEFRNMLVEPVKVDADSISSATDTPQAQPQDLAKTGVQWTADLPMTYMGKLSLDCAEKPQEYKLPSDKSSESSSGVSASKFWVKPKKKEIQRTYYDVEQTKNLNAEMEKFDKEHPRCFDPPRRMARTLLTAELMRRQPTN